MSFFFNGSIIKFSNNLNYQQLSYVNLKTIIIPGASFDKICLICLNRYLKNLINSFYPLNFSSV